MSVNSIWRVLRRFTIKPGHGVMPAFLSERRADRRRLGLLGYETNLVIGGGSYGAVKNGLNGWIIANHHRRLIKPGQTKNRPAYAGYQMVSEILVKTSKK